MTRCAFCRRRMWPWQRLGWMVGHGAWHPRCWRERYPERLTLAEIQRILDEAQR